MKMKEDFASLTSEIFDESDFPLVNNGLLLVIGGAGSGKSYFMYNYLLTIYVDFFLTRHILICSKTAACDSTLQKSLSFFKRYKSDSINIIIDSDMAKLFDTAQLIRAQAIKTQWCKRLYQLKNPSIKKYRLEIRKLKNEILSMKSYPTIQNELRTFLDNILEPIFEEDNYHIINKEKFEDPKKHNVLGPSGFDTLDNMYIKKLRDKKGNLLTDEDIIKNEDEGDNSFILDNSDFSSDSDDSDNDHACVQTVILNNPITDQNLKEMIYDEKDQEEYEKREDNCVIELSYGIVIRSKRQLNKKLKDKLISKRMRQNVENLLLASMEVFGPIHQPILIIVDDNAVNTQLSNPRSSFTQLCITRRHLHCSIVVLVQSVTFVNTNIRRNATSYHLLPTMSSEDLKLIEKRLPRGLLDGELADRYIKNIQNPDRTQKMTHIFNVNPYNMICDGCPDCVLQYKV